MVECEGKQKAEAKFILDACSLFTAVSKRSSQHKSKNV